ncbi:hypothetical protein [Mesorhizobium amorphae]|uniref:hypothetical protein n=1 Tax=Mesorhizobium amorphae TaxID=71433 RepID=UPI0017837FA0|nr:hypothetical protein [Mesorhizobium amorphae]
MIVAPDKSLSATVDSAMREIVSAAHRPEGSYVNLPILYPSGSAAVVRISGGPDKFFVTDFGLGYSEAEMMGADRTYVRQAKAIGQNSGVGFDEHSFFVLEVPLDRIPGAIVTIANCSVETVTLCAYKMAEKAAVDASEFLIARLEAVFGAERIARHEKVVGASNHEWDFTAALKDGRRTSLFEFATKHPNSVASVAMKMNDIALLDRAPQRIVMVHNKMEMGTYLGVLSHSSNVIEEAMPIEQMRRLAA